MPFWVGAVAGRSKAANPPFKPFAGGAFARGHHNPDMRPDSADPSPDHPLQTLDDPALAARALATLDLTSLRGDEDGPALDALVDKTAHPAGAPAALCVYPGAVARVRRGLDARGLQRVAVATVVAFPEGDASPQQVAIEIERALAEGADEIDTVLPWRALQAAARGDRLEGLSVERAEAAVRAVLRAAREATGERPLKVILESGELAEAALIETAARLALDAGADFIKTSTGKARVHATPAAVQVMLAAIDRHGAAGGGLRGLKVSGGVQTLADVRHYLGLAAATWGVAGLTPQRLRIGASGLWPVLIASIPQAGGAPPGPPAATDPTGY